MTLSLAVIACSWSEIIMQTQTQTCKRISDRVNNRIVASVLGVEGLPVESDAAVARAAADELRNLRTATNNVACVVREVVNGAVRAAQFTHMLAETTARATIIGVLRGARLAGIDEGPVIALTSERIVWSTAALGERLSPCVRGAVEGAMQGSPAGSAERRRLLDIVIAKALAAVNEIDERQVAEVRREIDTVVS